MREMHKKTQILAEDEGTAAYRFCLLLTARTHKAEDAAFQGFLYLAERTDELPDARRELYRCLYRAAEDALYRKDAAPMKKAAFVELSGLTVSDGLWRWMKQPLKQRAALFLVRCALFSAADAAAILGVRAERVEKWLAAAGDVGTLCAELAAWEPSPAWAEQLGDNLLMRWQERNVPLENRLLRIRSAADRAVPWLALAAVLFCVAAAWYTARLNAALGG
ncbi:MAG: hypothetical protein E7425_14560 [Ruminococcaceae bacterium]|nr:hypothetical protein [Oscillospiraceae bacterium]